MYFEITFLETSSNFTKSKIAPLTLILLNSNLNSDIGVSGFALLQLSKLEFPIFIKYSQTAFAGIPSS